MPGQRPTTLGKIESTRLRDPQAAWMTFAELVCNHHLPTYAQAAGNTVENRVPRACSRGLAISIPVCPTTQGAQSEYS
jgi:hypothetical protein